MRLSVLNFFSSPEQLYLLAELCDRLPSVHRLWVGEHHSATQVPDPLTLAVILAGTTERIRVGTGAMSLTFRNPGLIAETALLVESFFPGRVDLGVTRAGLASPEVRAVLLDGIDADDVARSYDRRLVLLRDLLIGEQTIGPRVPGVEPTLGPPMFVMGTNIARATQAGALGVGFVASFYHGGSTDEIRAMMHAYRDSFRPSPWFDTPQPIVVVSGFVSQDPDEIAAMLRERDAAPEPGPGAARKIVVHGRPEPAATELRRLGAAVAADEVMFLCQRVDCASCYRDLSEGWESTAMQ